MITAIDVYQKVRDAHAVAMHQAQHAAYGFAFKHFEGQDSGPCGFAWVNAYKVRSNSKVGKALQAVGFRKSYDGGLQLWNKWWPGQSVDAAAAGADAYAETMRKELDLIFYAGSRLD